MIRIALAGIIAAMAAVGADPAKPPVAANPTVNISGRISRVDAFRPGQGMPTIEVDVDGKATSVVLGSMRYLMEQNFNPKAGTQVQVKGYKTPTAIVAIEVHVPGDGTTLKLRDENGWPLWRGGGCRHCGGRSQ